MNDIIVNNLKKKFLLLNSNNKVWYKRFYNYLIPTHKNHIVLDHISFSIKRGEKVAIIGPNGAGKSTLIKILTGILYPDDGLVTVLNKYPCKQRKELAKDIGVVFGHCSHLWVHLPIYESYNLLAAIYNLKQKDYKNKLNYLISKFDIKSFLSKEAIKLSLGERTRCEIVASLLHSPQLLLFDEPTIGLDILAKTELRNVVNELVKKNNNTLIFTSHDIEDIEKICERVIMMNKGKIILNSRIQELKKNYKKKTAISIFYEQKKSDWNFEGTKILDQKLHYLKIEVDLSKTNKNIIISEILKKYTINDINFENLSLETIIKDLYQYDLQNQIS